MLNNEIIKKAVFSWKSEHQRKNENTYTFYVDPLASKFQLKKVLEEAFAIKVKKISSLREKPVLRNSRFKLRTKLRKKIFVRLKEGYKIGEQPSSEKPEANVNASSVDDHQQSIEK